MADKKETPPPTHATLKAKIGALRASVSVLKGEIQQSKLFENTEVADYLGKAYEQLDIAYNSA